jgi:hypothetical protein
MLLAAHTWLVVHPSRAVWIMCVVVRQYMQARAQSDLLNKELQSVKSNWATQVKQMRFRLGQEQRSSLDKCGV